MIQETEIKRYVTELAREFRPERVILFGSHAGGNATDDSDVDLLVIMNHRDDSTEQALKIRLRIPRKFPLDLLVRKPSEVRRRLAMRDTFLSSILREGRVLYARRGQRAG
jgi:predicted nucleotidyltransferase